MQVEGDATVAGATVIVVAGMAATVVATTWPICVW